MVHTSTETAPAPRPWHVVTRRVDRFHWLLGLRGALAFAGPMVVAHLAGAPFADAAVMSLAGLLVALVGSSLPAGRSAALTGAGLVAVLPLVVALHAVVDPHGAGQILVIGAAGVLAGIAPLVAPSAAVLFKLAGIGVIITGELPATMRTAGLLVAGGAAAILVLVATRPLAHPRLGLPALPAARSAVASREATVRHALRLGVTLLAVAIVAHEIGHGSPFAARSSWMLLGVWIAMQPDRQATAQFAVRRGLGTAAGALVTLVLVAVAPPAVWLGWIFLVLAFVGFGLRTVNYAWYCVAITPVIVVGFAGTELNREVLAARVVWTTVGVAAALAARFALWPADTRAAAPELAAA